MRFVLASFVALSFVTIACYGSELVIVPVDCLPTDSGTDTQTDMPDVMVDVKNPETTCASPYGQTLSMECQPGFGCETYSDAGADVHGICSDCKTLRPFCLDLHQFVNCDCKGCGAPHNCLTDSPPPGYPGACASGYCMAPW